ncbi:PREDICTED: nascent polypeptide-associated complex subunit alpha, muscle-specific form-like [Myotis brandtii]|uniref:nascent polypeptide-associated complex subunit alpha, muscle-specific form-like n=1 Tax=Myotis brandtii TaxID=109478 RepID=UPI000703C502|nr:PREDICTED: nascent polypeptide-associated complex subunit alpha, muscle-specific form-like [Myotis brandtii]
MAHGLHTQQWHGGGQGLLHCLPQKQSPPHLPLPWVMEPQRVGPGPRCRGMSGWPLWLNPLAHLPWGLLGTGSCPPTPTLAWLAGPGSALAFSPHGLDERTGPQTGCPSVGISRGHMPTPSAPGVWCHLLKPGLRDSSLARGSHPCPGIRLETLGCVGRHSNREPRRQAPPPLPYPLVSVAGEEEAVCASSQSCRWALCPALGRDPGATWGGRQSPWEGPAPGALWGCTLPPSQAPPAHLLGVELSLRTGWRPHCTCSPESAPTLLPTPSLRGLGPPIQEAPPQRPALQASLPPADQPRWPLRGRPGVQPSQLRAGWAGTGRDRGERALGAPHCAPAWLLTGRGRWLQLALCPDPRPLGRIASPHVRGAVASAGRSSLLALPRPLLPPWLSGGRCFLGGAELRACLPGADPPPTLGPGTSFLGPRPALHRPSPRTPPTCPAETWCTGCGPDGQFVGLCSPGPRAGSLRWGRSLVPSRATVSAGAAGWPQPQSTAAVGGSSWAGLSACLSP